VRRTILAAGLLGAFVCGACTSPTGPSPPVSGSKNGPLPVQWTFHVAAPYAHLYVGASAFAQSHDQPLEVLVVVDGTVAGRCRIFSNGGLTHRALVCPMIPLRLEPGAHVLELRAGNAATASDGEDVYEFAVVEP